MKHFINLKDISASNLRKIIYDAKRRKKKRKNLNALDIDKDNPLRGKGLLIGLQLHKDQSKFIQKLMDNNLLTIRAAENVIRILPPLTVKKKEVDLAIKIIKKVCKEYQN